MKNSIFFIVFISFSTFMVGQEYEVGFSLGGTNYVGEIGRTNYVYPNEIGGAAFFKYNWNPRIAVRATYSYLPIKGDNANADRDLPLVKGIDVSEYSFTNTIHELAIGMEYNFYEYDLSDEEKNWTPYILLELNAFNYKTLVSGTSSDNFVYKNKTSFAIPFGVGYKSKLIGNFAFAVEAKFRYTTQNISPLNIAKPGKDWYMFTGISIMYTFGRPPCYTNGL